MSVVSVAKDPTELTMTVTCEFPASPERVWQLWADPRQLERWWGPPTWPATFEVHDLRPGGRAQYRMTGPDGSTSGGYWEFESVEPPRLIELRDGFINPDGSPNTDMPGMRLRVTIDGVGQDRTRMVLLSEFPSVEAMNTLLEMGMEQGLAAALGQIDAVLAESQAA